MRAWLPIMPKTRHRFRKVAHTGCLRAAEVPQVMYPHIFSPNDFQRRCQVVAEHAVVEVAPASRWKQLRRRAVPDVGCEVVQEVGAYVAAGR